MSENVAGEKLDSKIAKVYFIIQNTQWILGSMRVTINNGIVGPVHTRHSLYSLLLFTLASFSEYHEQMVFYHKFMVTNRNLILYYTCLIGIGAEYLSYIFCLYAAKFTKRENNLLIYSKLQNIDRILEIYRTDYFYNFQAKVLNVCLLLICTLFPLGFVINSVVIMAKLRYSWFLIPIHLTIYVDTILFGSFLYFLGMRTAIFNKKIENYIAKFDMTPNTKSSKTLASIVLSLIIPSYDGVDDTLVLDKWMVCIHEILKTYQVVSDIFSFLMLKLAVTVMLWTFVAIAAILEGLKSGLYPKLGLATVGAWASFYYLLLTSSAILNDYFLHNIKKTKVLCVRVMSHNYDDAYHKTASRVLRLIHYAKPKIVVYGIFTFDTSLTLTLMGIIASNVLVVVQFVVSRE